VNNGRIGGFSRCFNWCLTVFLPLGRRLAARNSAAFDRRNRCARYSESAAMSDVHAPWAAKTRKGPPNSMSLPRNAEIWLLPYLKDKVRKSLRPAKPRRAWVTITDHYEPIGKQGTVEGALRRVAQWQEKWPKVADNAPRDAAGQCPQHTFFYPQEEYDRGVVDGIAEMVRLGVGDVEVHLHHKDEQRDSFIEKITDFCRRLRNDHGLLRHRDGRTLFGFIHGNWALDNSHPDGKFCGLNGEIALLRDLGCYADFTMPSIPSPTQGRVVNQIYWCTNNRDNRPKSFDQGVVATAGGGRQGDLLMITGPVGLRFGGRLMPRVETGELAGNDMPTTSRVRRWLDLAPVIGEDLFLKLHTHGAADRSRDQLLNTGLANLFSMLAEEADQRGIEIHWATAWQMYQAVDALIHARSPVPVSENLIAESSR